MDYETFLKQKDALTKALEEAMMAVLETMPIEDIKKLDWFSSRAIEECTYDELNIT